MSFFLIAVVRVFLVVTTIIFTMPWWYGEMTNVSIFLTTAVGVLGYIATSVIVYATSKD